MNSIDENPNYKEIYKFIEQKYFETDYFNSGPFDESFFSLRVYETCKDIIKLIDVPVKKQQLLVAALLHDIGKIKLNVAKVFDVEGVKKKNQYVDEWKKHPELSLEIVKPYLNKKGHSDGFIEEVCYLIKNHDKRMNLKDKTIELKILQDADLLADVGFAGFIRPFLYGGKFNRSTVHTIKFITSHKGVRVSDLNEINLDVSKEIAKKEIELEKNMIKEMAKDIESDVF